MAVLRTTAAAHRHSSAVLHVSIPAGGRAIACWRTPDSVRLHEVSASGAEVVSVWLEGQPLQLTGKSAPMEAYDCVEVRLINRTAEDAVASVVLHFDPR